MNSRLVLLDRDGVINADSPDYIRSVEDWKPLPGSLDAIALLTQSGYRVVVVTNQSGVGRGLLSVEMLQRIHRHMLDAAAAHGGVIEAVFFCPHLPDAGCDCRKPKPGMLNRIAERMHRPLDGVPFVGDSARDLEAARAAGATPVLVRTGNGLETEAALEEAVAVHDDLAAFAGALVAERQ